MNPASKVLCLVALVGLVACQQVSCQDQPRDELQLNRNDQSKEASEDTTIVTDAPTTNPASQPATTLNPVINIDDDDDQGQPDRRHRLPFSNPFRFLMPFDLDFGFGGGHNNRPGFGFGGGFGSSDGASGSFGGSGNDLFGGLFDRLDRHVSDMQRDFERQAGEGQDVSYFNRNGVAYVRTCTTRKLSPGEQAAPNQEVKDLSKPARQRR